MNRTCPICKCVIGNADFCPYCLWDFRTCVDNQYQQTLLRYAEKRKHKSTEMQKIIDKNRNADVDYKKTEKKKMEKSKEQSQLSCSILGKYTGHNQNNETLLSSERYNELSQKEINYKQQERLKSEIVVNKKHIDTFEFEKQRFKEFYKTAQGNRYKFNEAEKRAKNKVGGTTNYNYIVNKYTK